MVLSFLPQIKKTILSDKTTEPLLVLIITIKVKAIKWTMIDFKNLLCNIVRLLI